jgi:hypothetical protein
VQLMAVQDQIPVRPERAPRPPIAVPISQVRAFVASCYRWSKYHRVLVNARALTGPPILVELLYESKEFPMPQIEVSEQQIVDALDRLSPKGRRDAVRRLIAGAAGLDRTIDALQPRLAEVARQRGLDWAKLSDEERERLVDEILHE